MSNTIGFGGAVGLLHVNE